MSNALLVALLRARLLVKMARSNARRAGELLVAAGMKTKDAILYVLDLTGRAAKVAA